MDQANPVRRNVLLRDLLVFLVFAGLSVILTWPMAARLTTHVPQFPGDTQWVIWLLGWNYKTLLAGHFSGYWDANIFYPAAHTLALSEHSAFLAVTGLPVCWLTHNLLLVHNVLFLFSFALTGYATFRLALHMVPSIPAALFAGIAFAFTTYRFDHLCHLTTLQTQWLPLILLNFLAFIRERKAIYAVGLAVFLIFNALSLAYYMMFSAVILAAIFPVALAGSKRIGDRRLWLGLAIVAIVVAGVVVPFYLPYLKARPELKQRQSEAAMTDLSATPLSFVSGPVPVAARNYAPWLSRIWRPELNFFPGFLPILLGLGCLFYPRNFRAVGGLLHAPRHFLMRYFFPAQTYRGLWLFVALFAALLAMGPVLILFGEKTIRGPYYFLYRFVPGFDALRAVSRIAVFAVLTLCVLAAYGFADLEHHFAKKGLNRFALRAALIGGIVVESMSLPMPTAPVETPAQFPAVYHWLAGQPGDFGIAEIPMGEPDIPYMYYSTLHWKRLVNGYSSFYPPGYAEAKDAINQFPAPVALEALKRLGARYLILHSGKMGRPAPETPVGEAQAVQRFGDDVVYEIGGK